MHVQQPGNRGRDNSTLLSCIVAIPLANLFVSYRFPFKAFWQTALMSPLILPPFVGAIGIQQFFSKFGTLNHILGLVGPGVKDPTPIDWLGASGFWGIAIMQTLHLFPIFFLNLTSAFQNINPSLHEAARCLGAKRPYIFRSITLPLLTPAIYASAVIVFIWAFTDLGTPLIFGFHKVVAVQIFDKVNETGFNPFGYTLVIIVLALTVGLFLWSRRFVSKRDFVTETKGAVHESQLDIKPTFQPVLFLGLCVLAVLCLLPHLMVLLQSVTGKWFMTAVPEQWTTSHYREVFTLPQTIQGLRNSFIYASLSAILDVILGFFIAYWLVRKNFFGKKLLDALTVLPLALPGIVLAFGYVVSFNIPNKWQDHDMNWLRSFVNPRENPMLLLIISYSIRRLPLIVRTASAGFQQMSVSMEEASLNLGASHLTTMRKIVVPLLKGPLIGGAILTFAFAFLEVSDSLILAMQERFYPTTKTIYVLLGRIEPGASFIASALGIVGMLLLGISFFVASKFLRKKIGSLFG
jgi:iron(III) transport system permease protein